MEYNLLSQKSVIPEKSTMIILFYAALILAVFTYVVKKQVWVVLKSTQNVSLQQSFLCWFTLTDIHKMTNKEMRWSSMVNNISNIVMAVCLVIMLVCCSVLGLGFLN